MLDFQGFDKVQAYFVVHLYAWIGMLMISLRLYMGRAIVEISTNSFSLPNFIPVALPDFISQGSMNHNLLPEVARADENPTTIIQDELGAASEAAPLVSFSIREHASLPRSSAFLPIAEEQLFQFENGVSYYFRPSSQEYRITIGDTVQGLIDFKSGTVTWDLAGSLLPRAALHVLLLDPLSLLLPEYGMLICHGAALCDPEGASLMFGRSGAGKSTLSALLSQGSNPGAQWLSDDTFLLDFSQTKIAVSPVQTGFGLQPWLIQHFELPEWESNILQRSQGKTYFRSVSRQGFGSHPVHRLIFLDQTSELNIGVRGTAGECKEAEAAILDADPDCQAETEVEWLRPDQTLHRLLSSQTVIPHPSLTERVFLWQRLIGQVSSACLHYRNICEPEAILYVLNNGGTDNAVT